MAIMTTKNMIKKVPKKEDENERMDQNSRDVTGDDSIRKEIAGTGDCSCEDCESCRGCCSCKKGDKE